MLGFKSAMVYTNQLKEMGIAFETINEKQQAELDAIVMKVMEGRDNATDRTFVKQLVNELRSRNADGIIPGCTELPLLLKEDMNHDDMINPAQLLAEAAVKYSLS